MVQFRIALLNSDFANWHRACAAGTEVSITQALYSGGFGVEKCQVRTHLNDTICPHIKVEVASEDLKHPIRVYVQGVMALIRTITISVAHNVAGGVNYDNIYGTDQATTQRLTEFIRTLKPDLSDVTMGIVISFMRSRYGFKAVNDVLFPPHQMENHPPEGDMEPEAGESLESQRNRQNQVD